MAEHLKNLRMGQTNTLCVAGLAVAVQPEDIAGMQVHLAVFEGADAQLRSLQVHENADGIAALCLHGADDLVIAPVIFVTAMREVEPKNVCARIVKRGNGLGRSRGRTQGRNDLDLACVAHGPTAFLLLVPAALIAVVLG